MSTRQELEESMVRPFTKNELAEIEGFYHYYADAWRIFESGGDAGAFTQRKAIRHIGRLLQTLAVSMPSVEALIEYMQAKGAAPCFWCGATTHGHQDDCPVKLACTLSGLL